MTDRDRYLDLGATMSRLRKDVRRNVPAPPAGQVRQRAEHRLRVRRIATALGAAAFVGIVLIGGGLVWQSATPAPPHPGNTTTPTNSPAPDPRPSKSIPPWPTQRPQGAIAGTDWEQATITLPDHPGCPSGPVTFRREEFKGGTEVIGPASYPRVIIGASSIVYGDLTGDGEPEAVLGASCWQGEEDSGDGEGQLLVIRRFNGILTAMGWAGPRGAIYTDFWVADHRLNVEARPWHDDWGYQLGSALAYEWDGRILAEVGDSGFTGLLPLRPNLGPVIDVTPVAALIGCPAATLRFPSDGRTTAAGTSWDLAQPTLPENDPYLVDLDGDGERRVLAVFTCGRPLSGPPPGTSFVAVLQPRTDGSYVAIDAIPIADGWIIRGWRYATGYLTLELWRDEVTQEPRYAWNGEYFQEAS
jgi:hypothetical protein